MINQPSRRMDYIRGHRVAFLLLAMCLPILGCQKFVVDRPAITNELIYDAHRRLQKQIDGMRRSLPMTGKREYAGPKTAKGTFDTWTFSFENPEDQLTLRIFDSSGLEDGDEVQFNLSHIQNGRAVQKWRIQAAFPPGKPDRLHDLAFKFKMGAPVKAIYDMGDDIPFLPTVNVSGEYILSETTRAIEVELVFNVRRKMPVAEVGKMQD